VPRPASGAPTVSSTRAPEPPRTSGGRRSGFRELGVLVALYGAYSASRLLADDGLAGAVAVADALVRLESRLGLAFEADVIGAVVGNEALRFAASLWYATTHYVLTAAVLVVLWFRAPHVYRPLRRVLMVASLAALVFYLVLPTAPPRLTGAHYPDVLALTADQGWWGAEASAPEGWGGLTNQLAAFPSMHAGWALWVTLVAFAWSSSRLWRAAATLYALTTGLVVLGTGNHWTLDVLAGWALVAAAAVVVLRRGERKDSASGSGALTLRRATTPSA
jgi:hypothetical protein